MRNLPLLVAVMVILIYLAISWLSWVTLHRLVKNTIAFRLISCLYTGLTASQILAFTVLFIYPFSSATATFYPVYFIYNSILIAEFFVKIPLAMVAPGILLFRNFRIRFALSFGSFLVSCGIALAFAWGFTIGPRSLQKSHVELYFSNLPESFDGYRIAVLSDTHLGNFHYKRLLERSIEANNEFKPDILLFTGDLVNNFAEETKGWDFYFKRFSANDGKYAVLGNHDYGYYYRWPSSLSKQMNFKGIRKSFEDFGFDLLDNRSVAVARGMDSIFIIGVENWGHPPFPQYGDLELAGKHIRKGNFRILMSHDPAHWEEVVKFNEQFPLTFSGHSHGFQWGIKLAGFEFSLARMARENWGGLYSYRDNYLYVNKGIGTIGLPLRLDMPAEITFVTLRKR